MELIYAFNLGLVAFDFLMARGPVANNNVFQKLRIEGWRQFRSIEIDIHPKLTIITGANGAGKSTLLSFFTRHFGYARNYLAIPQTRKGLTTFSLGTFDWLKQKASRWFKWTAQEEKAPVSPTIQIGEVFYSTGGYSAIMLPSTASLHYSVELSTQQGVNGIHIDSHRPPNVYRGVGSIPSAAPPINGIGSGLNSEYVTYYSNGMIQQGSLYHIKMTLIQMSIFGYGNKTMDPVPELIELFNEFEEKLRKILPKSLGFKRLIIRSPEIILSTGSGDFLIDAASGGIIKLFEVAWQIFFYSKTMPEGERFVITFDEPENHLHPSMQKSFLPNLMEAFPQAQIIAVTHSPFIITAMKDSNVYVLRYEDTEVRAPSEQGSDDDQSIRGLMGTKVVAERLDTINKAGTASEILRDVLGISATIPDWAEDRVQEIVGSYRNAPLDADALNELRSRLEAEGLISSYPHAVAQLTRAN